MGLDGAAGDGKCNGGRFTFRVDDWCSYLISVRGLAAATVERYRYLVEQLVARLDEPAGLTRLAIEDHLKRLHLAGRGAAVRRGAVVAIRSYGEWLAAHGIVESNPAARLRGPRVYRREKPHFSVGEIEKLIWGERQDQLPKDLLELRNRALLAVTYVAGLRASEPGRLRAEGLAWDEQRQAFSVRVEGRKAAEGDVRLHLNRRVSRLLGAYLPLRERIDGGRTPWLFPPVRGERPLSRSAVLKIFTRRLGEAGIERKGRRRLTPHALRHSIATHLLEAGWDPKTVQAHMGHASLETTGQYLHTSDQKVARAFDRKDPLGGRRQRPQVQGALGALLRELGAGLQPGGSS